MLTFVLDLTADGTLSVGVGEKPLMLVFSNMKDQGDEFVPAVFLRNGARVEFLGFEK